MMNAGIIPPDAGYLEGVRELTRRYGVLLAFDEVKTGLSVHPGGSTGLFGVTPDIVCLAKALGRRPAVRGHRRHPRGDGGDQRWSLRPGRHLQRQPADDGRGTCDADRGAHRRRVPRGRRTFADDVRSVDCDRCSSTASPATATRSASRARWSSATRRRATAATSSAMDTGPQPSALPRAAQRRRVHGAVGQERAVDDLADAHRCRRRPVLRQRRAIRRTGRLIRWPLSRVRHRRVLLSSAAMTSNQLIPTLTGHEYSSDEVYEREREQIFHKSWFYVCRDDRLAPGDRFVADVAGESVLLVKDREGQLHAHANVCRHRGARLCEESGPGSKAGITCPYHAWTYALDGRLIGTPHLGRRRSRPRLAVAVERGVRGRGTVSCSSTCRPSPRRCSSRSMPGMDSVRLFEHLHLGELRTGVTTSTDVQGQLEDPRRELPGVPALLVGASRARRHRAGVQDGLGGRPDRGPMAGSASAATASA